MTRSSHGSARDAFYKGEPARAAGRFYAQFDDGLVTYEDLAAYESRWMAPLHTRFRGYDVTVCDGWSQGPRLILFLKLLKNFDLHKIPGWGFGLGRRMEQLNLDPRLGNVMAPKKRPRNTNTPILVMKQGKPFMGLSTPGGEQQLQAILQVFLNVVVWGLSPEQALDQPRFGSYNFPITGSEVNETPGRLCLEERIPAETFEALRRMGHDVVSWGLWNWKACAVTVTYRDPERGILLAAGDVRRETYALGF